MQEGVAVGEERFAELVQCLLLNHRNEEIQKAASDKMFRQKIYEEFGIGVTVR